MGEKTKVAISCGDLNGIGIETLLKTFSDTRMYKHCIPVIYANKSILTAHNNTIQNNQVTLHEIKNLEEAKEDVINIITCIPDDVSINFGQPDSKNSKHTIESLKLATADVMSGKADVLVTLPINKDVINQADFQYPGHTEYLKSTAGVEESLMFLVSEAMKVGLVTNHLPIKEVENNISQASIITKVKLMHDALKNDFGIQKPKIAILGLNPHAGDNGLIGSEELSVIVPAIEKLMQEDVLAVGPYSADGFFGMGMYSKFDGVMAMYHDQGLLPFKMISFDEGVNFTAGLPFVRTSPDHGTAYDIAGKNKANPESLRNSIFMAVNIQRKRAQN